MSILTTTAATLRDNAIEENKSNSLVETMNTAAERRIKKELKELQENPLPNCAAAPIDIQDLYSWRAVILGPDDSPYEGGVFFLSIHFPKKYPFQPPSVFFETLIYHCNISLEGAIAMESLNEQWTCAFSISTVLLSVYSLLTDINPDHVLNWEAGRVYELNRYLYDQTAKEWTQFFAVADNLPLARCEWLDPQGQMYSDETRIRSTGSQQQRVEGPITPRSTDSDMDRDGFVEVSASDLNDGTVESADNTTSLVPSTDAWLDSCVTGGSTEDTSIVTKEETSISDTEQESSSSDSEWILC